MAEYVNGGFILLAWKLLENNIMEAPPLHLKLWIWMLLNANHKDRNGIKRGQLFTSINGMQAAMSYKVGYRKNSPSRDQIRNAYEALTKPHMITTTKTTRGLVITICNYDKYQSIKNYEAHNEAPHENTTKPQDGPHYTQGMLKNGKNEKNILFDHEPEISVIDIPLSKNGEVYHVTENKVKEWQECFPGVNILNSLKKIKAWNIANPTKRKTSRGIEAHIVSWLSKEQDKPKLTEAKKRNPEDWL